MEEDYTSFVPVVVDLDKVEFPNKNNFKVSYNETDYMILAIVDILLRLYQRSQQLC